MADVKPDIKDETITIKVKDQSGDEVVFKVRWVLSRLSRLDKAGHPLRLRRGSCVPGGLVESAR